jgi:hypothetical protein
LLVDVACSWGAATSYCVASAAIGRYSPEDLRAIRYNFRLLRLPPDMELAKSFEPHAIEAKWYPLWESRG